MNKIRVSDVYFEWVEQATIYFRSSDEDVLIREVFRSVKKLFKAPFRESDSNLNFTAHLSILERKTQILNISSLNGYFWYNFKKGTILRIQAKRKNCEKRKVSYLDHLGGSYSWAKIFYANNIIV